MVVAEVISEIEAGTRSPSGCPQNLLSTINLPTNQPATVEVSPDSIEKAVPGLSGVALKKRGAA